MIRVLPIRRASRIYKIGLNSWTKSRSVVKFDLANRVINFMRARMIPDLLVSMQFLKRHKFKRHTNLRVLTRYLHLRHPYSNSLRDKSVRDG